METQISTTDKLTITLLKEPLVEHTATSVARSLGITRQGVWKILNRLDSDKIISLKSIADTKKSAVKIDLQLENPVTIKILSLLLTKESLQYERWRINFAALEKHTYFLILFGSILYNTKEANDIDLLAVVNKKTDFKFIDETASKIQKTQLKKIHVIKMTREELMMEMKKNNHAYLDALKKGAILFGHDNFLKFITKLKK